jgi:GNAT superfamily N-acetyltransferase
VELVELAELTEHDWAGLIDGEDQPWGALGEQLQWREKDRYVGLRGGDGRLLAVAGAAIAEVVVEQAGSFQVVGLGGLFVTRSARGRGFIAKLAGPLLQIAADMGPDRAMIFCRPELLATYRRLAFAEIPDPVRVDQPDGRVEMPLAAMWRGLRDGASWPTGRVDVRGLPF